MFVYKQLHLKDTFFLKFAIYFNVFLRNLGQSSYHVYNFLDLFQIRVSNCHVLDGGRENN